MQFIAGRAGDLLDQLTAQDVVSFTGSAATGAEAARHPQSSRANSVRFIAERDSLNASVLGPDAAPGTAGIRPLRQGSASRDDGEGRAEMHRHPPHHRARARMRDGGRRRSPRGWRRRASATRATKASAWARSPAWRSATTCCEQGRRHRPAKARSSSAIPKSSRSKGADARSGAFLPPMLLRCNDPRRRRERARRRGVRPGVDA